MPEVKKFILGRDKTPDWFNVEAKSGRVRINYDEDGNIVNATVYSPTKTSIAKIGDVIMSVRSGIVVLDEEKAKKYKVVGGRNATEGNKTEG